MKKTPLFPIFLLSFLSFSFAQNDTESVIKPMLLDKSVLSGVGLKKIELTDEPEKDFYQKRLFNGKDISIYVVSTETWDNQFTNFWFDEFVYMLHGEAVVKPISGRSQIFHSGEPFFAPKGFTGEWSIIAGDQLHYELSVISSQRADSSFISSDLTHSSFGQSILSGAHIVLDESGQYAEILKAGVELTVGLQAEHPNKHSIDMAKDQLIHLLSGQVRIEDSEGLEYVFYTGDFFVLPKGCKAFWESQGHGLVKFLTVEKTIHDVN